MSGAREVFEPLRQRAKAKWQALVESPYPKIYLGMATCGRAAGASGVWETTERRLREAHVAASIISVGCIGLCYAEPLLDIQKPGQPRISYRCPSGEHAEQLLEDCLVGDALHPELALGTIGDGVVEGIGKFFDLPMLKGQVRIVLRNCGFINPEDIDHYIAQDGYLGFLRVLEMTPKDVTEEVKKSGLRGRGGAGFPTGQKWEFCRSSPGTEKYLICNADEGDPGAFMNRSLLEGDPHAVLEGMLIAGYALGASGGYIYCRAEYPLAVERIGTALIQMAEYGLLGENILGSEFSFTVILREGAGAFVCGEETALMASVEGKRGMPRPRPPFPAVRGLWGKPTNINNVETLGTLPNILRNGAEWYAQYGTEKCRGTKTFSLVGKVERTGLIEVPLGTKLGDVIFNIGGGISGGKAFKAVQSGGPSGGSLPVSTLGLPLDYESLTQA
ncbi:MAG: SLBB domain-containing protein, partial [Chloroflexota bacterium]